MVIYPNVQMAIIWGLAEWIKLNRELNPNVDLTFTLNINDSVKKTIWIWRVFLFLDPDDAAAADEDGFNLAQYRVDLGDNRTGKY
ncbi:MAG: hypothetical protein L6V93_00845 [Clostridiales bacterium]|nr:MAG: hypothetical protein L6V93_00845 [Clostridiales bacterium]